MANRPGAVLGRRPPRPRLRINPIALEYRRPAMRLIFGAGGHKPPFGTAIRRHLISDVVPLDDGPGLLVDLAARRRHVVQAVFAVEG